MTEEPCDEQLEPCDSWKPQITNKYYDCNSAIEPYYRLDKAYHKMIPINNLLLIKDDIRNFRPLNKHKMQYIQHLPDKDKNDLLIIFNDCIKIMGSVISNK